RPHCQPAEQSSATQIRTIGFPGSDGVSWLRCIAPRGRKRGRVDLNDRRDEGSSEDSICDPPIVDAACRQLVSCRAVCPNDCGRGRLLRLSPGTEKLPGYYPS